MYTGLLTHALKAARISRRNFDIEEDIGSRLIKSE